MKQKKSSGTDVTCSVFPPAPPGRLMLQTREMRLQCAKLKVQKIKRGLSVPGLCTVVGQEESVVCLKTLAADSMKPTEWKRHFDSTQATSHKTIFTVAHLLLLNRLPQRSERMGTGQIK